MYSWHYQDQHDKLILRYDNADHTPELASPHHKYLENEIIATEAPELKDVIVEIIQNYLAIN